MSIHTKSIQTISQKSDLVLLFAFTNNIWPMEKSIQTMTVDFSNFYNGTINLSPHFRIWYNSKQ